MNLDTRTEDDLKVYLNSTIVPAIKIGSPITLATLSSLKSDTTESGTITLDDSLNTQCSSDYDTANNGAAS
jgi:hypothetical protein